MSTRDEYLSANISMLISRCSYLGEYLGAHRVRSQAEVRLLLAVDAHRQVLVLVRVPDRASSQAHTGPSCCCGGDDGRRDGATAVVVSS